MKGEIEFKHNIDNLVKELWMQHTLIIGKVTNYDN